MTTAFPRVTPAQLRMFVGVAQHAGFSEAAAVLGLSQSTLSEAVAALERHLGARLFDRGPGGAVLTPQGQAAFEHARRVLQALTDLALSVQDGRLQGTLTVAAYRSLGIHILPPILARLRARHPDLELRVTNAETDSSGGQHLVLSGEADIGLIVLDGDPPLLTYPLYEDEYVVVVHQSRGVEPLSWGELREATLLLPSDRCCQRILAHLRRHEVEPAQVPRFAEDDVLLSMAAHRLGLAVLPSLAATPLRADLRAFPLPVPLPRQMRVATLPQRAGLPHIRAFLDALGQRDT